MHSDLDNLVPVIDDESVSTAPRPKKRKNKKKKKLYEQYLADSGSDESHVSSLDEPENNFECEDYTVGMDVSVLIHQTVQNIIQSVCLEDAEGVSGFGDDHLICFAAAVKHNSSIVSLQLKNLNVSDVSLVPLCRALEQHPSLRALDFSGTHGGGATSKALVKLVCTNASIIFTRADSTVVTAKDSEIVQEAMRYNALACPDPSNNPFHLGLLRKIGSMEEKEYKFNEGLQARAWLLNTGEGFVKREMESSTAKDDKKKDKKVGFRVNESSKFGGEICAQFVQGKCTYGSRCKYMHPERTAALTNSAALLQREYGDSVSVGFSVATSASSGRIRLQSRLRPSNYTLRKRKQVPKEDTDDDFVGEAPRGVSLPFVASLWTFSFTLMGCCAALALA